MSSDNVERKRAQASIQFLRTSFNPIANNTAPTVSTSSRSDILKDVTVQGQFIIPSTVPIGEGISFASGMILWLMKRGLASMYRMVFVPMGAVSNSAAPAPGYNGLNSNYTSKQDGEQRLQMGFHSRSLSRKTFSLES